MAKYVVFVLLSLLLIIISWRNLFNPESHGFWRFLSWECILWLGISNYKYWFVNPVSLNQIIAWIFLAYSLFSIFSGAMLMKKSGKPDSNRKEKDLYLFEKTTSLVEKGIFRYIRHPLYGSLLFLTWGIFLKRPEVYLLFISLLSSAFLIITAKIEERENISYFGDKYHDYQNKTKMFVPYLF